MAIHSSEERGRHVLPRTSIDERVPTWVVLRERRAVVYESADEN